MNIVFAGTPEFAVPTLRALLATGHDVVAVYTQPDRPAGRGRKLRASPVKELALEHGIPIEQPPTLRNAEYQATLAAYAPDLLVVVAYGLILPQAVLDLPRRGCVNVHASLLPRWRGAAPIQRAILAGDAETGVTLMRMEAGLDTGPMLAKAVCPIAAADTAADLHDRLASSAANCWPGIWTRSWPAICRAKSRTKPWPPMPPSSTRPRRTWTGRVRRPNSCAGSTPSIPGRWRRAASAARRCASGAPAWCRVGARRARSCRPAVTAPMSPAVWTACGCSRSSCPAAGASAARISATASHRSGCCSPPP
jgi:hypothetical protein